MDANDLKVLDQVLATFSEMSDDELNQEVFSSEGAGFFCMIDAFEDVFFAPVGRQSGYATGVYRKEYAAPGALLKNMQQDVPNGEDPCLLAA